MNFYNYTVELPFSNVKLKFRELNTNQQLLLAKANLSFGKDENSLYDYHEFVLTVISECVKNKNDIFEINVLEYILFLTKLKIISNGNILQFLINSDNKTKTKVKIDLKTYLMNLYNASNVLNEKNNKIIENDIEIKLNWPNINSISNFYNLFISKKQNNNFIEDTAVEFLEYVSIKKNKIILKNFNVNQKIEFFEKLPCSVKNEVLKRLVILLEELFKCELFDVSLFKEQKFNFYNLSFIEHIKLFYSYDVKSIHQEIYLLSSFGLPPDYVMKISPNERKLYFSIIQEQQKEQKSDSSKPEEFNFKNNTSDALKDLALEFGDIAP